MTRYSRILLHEADILGRWVLIGWRPMRDDLFYRVPTSLSVGDSNIDDGRSPSVLERMELTEMRMFLYLREPLPRG